MNAKNSLELTFSLANQTWAGVLSSNNSCEIQLNRGSYKHSRSRGWSRKDSGTSSFKRKWSRYENIEPETLRSNIEGFYFLLRPHYKLSALLWDTSQCGLHNVVIDDRLTKDGGRPSWKCAKHKHRRDKW